MSDEDQYAFYLLPGTDVLRNRLGLVTGPGVEAALSASAQVGWISLVREAIPDQLDLQYLQSIHSRLMGPVLEWAGELRRPGVEVGAGTTGLSYLRSRLMPEAVTGIFDGLREKNYLRGLDPDAFSVSLAKDWAALSYAHPFVDGNARTQGAFVDRLATKAGHAIDWTRIDFDALQLARIEGWKASDPYPLATLIRDNLVPNAAESAQLATRLDGDTEERLRRMDVPAPAPDPLAPRAAQPEPRMPGPAVRPHQRPPDSPPSEAPRLGL